MAREKINLLYVEDNPADFRFVKEILSGESGRFTLENCADIKSARERMYRGGVDAVLLDLSLPDSAGGDSFSRIKEGFADVPVIVLTGNDDETLAMGLMHEGAQDYILKDKLSAYILTRSVVHSIERNSIKKELRESRERLLMLFENMTEAFAYFKAMPGSGELYMLEEANDAYIKRFGKPGKGAFAALSSGDSSLTEAFDSALEKGRASLIECVLGDNRWYEVRVYRPVAGYIAMIANDITERKESERKISQQNQLNILRAEIWRIASQIDKGADKIIQEVSETAGPVLGFSRITHNKRAGNEFLSVSEWCARGVKPSIGEKLPASLVEHILKSGGISVITPENISQKVPPIMRAASEGIIRAMMEKQKLIEVVAMPYYINSRMEGVITFDSCVKESRVSMDGDIRSIVHDIVKIVSQAIVERRMYDELAENRAMYKTLFENMTNGFVYCRLDDDGADFSVVENNKSALEIMGNGDSGLEGISGSMLLSCDEQAFKQLMKKIKLVATAGGNARFDYYSRGREKWIYVNAYSTKKGYFALIIEDITERKRTEEELQRSEERFKTLFETAPFAYFLSDMKGAMVDINKKGQALIGYTKDEIRGSTYLDIKIIKPALYARAAMAMLKLTMGVRVEDEEYTISRKDGSEAAIIFNAFPVKISGENYIFGAALDITEKKKTEAALAESEKKYKAIFENIRSGFMFVKCSHTRTSGLSFNIVEANDFFAGIFGKERKEMQGMDVGLLFHKGDPDENGWKYYFEKAASGAAIPAFEYRDDAGEKWYSIAVYSPMQGYVACFAEDITLRKEAEANLVQGIEKLKEADRMKTSFISMVSHELRTPMTSIKGFTSMLRKGMAGEISEGQASYLDKIELNSERMMGLVNDLLDASKMESGAFTISPERADLALLLRREVNDLSVMAGRKSIKLILHAPESACPAIADPVRFCQAVSNLVNNAVKFSPENSEIEIGMKVYENGFNEFPPGFGITGVSGRQYMISVTDRGIGIPEGQLSKVFDKFYQVEDPETRKFRGTGLGLSITKNIIEAHGGAIWAKSEGRNRGSSFMVLLPEGKV